MQRWIMLQEEEAWGTVTGPIWPKPDRRSERTLPSVSFYTSPEMQVDTVCEAFSSTQFYIFSSHTFCLSSPELKYRQIADIINLMHYLFFLPGGIEVPWQRRSFQSMKFNLILSAQKMLMRNLILESSRTLTTKLVPVNNKKFACSLVGLTAWSQKNRIRFQTDAGKPTTIPFGSVWFWIAKQLPLYLPLQAQPLCQHVCRWWTAHNSGRLFYLQPCAHGQWCLSEDL